MHSCIRHRKLAITDISVERNKFYFDRTLSKAPAVIKRRRICHNFFCIILSETEVNLKSKVNQYDQNIGIE